MATSQGRMRTNYFRVADPERLREIVARAEGQDGENLLLFEQVIDDETLYGFGCEMQLQGYWDDEADEYDYDAFVRDLQTVVTPGDAIIIMEVGYERLRYVCGSALIITHDKTESLSLTTLALYKAAEVLGNPEYQTRIEY